MCVRSPHALDPLCFFLQRPGRPRPPAHTTDVTMYFFDRHMCLTLAHLWSLKWRGCTAFALQSLPADPLTPPHPSTPARDEIQFGFFGEELLVGGVGRTLPLHLMSLAALNVKSSRSLCAQVPETNPPPHQSDNLSDELESWSMSSSEE